MAPIEAFCSATKLLLISIASIVTPRDGHEFSANLIAACAALTAASGLAAERHAGELTRLRDGREIERPSISVPASDPALTVKVATKQDGIEGGT